jgi:epoxyqueuosine reductase
LNPAVLKSAIRDAALTAGYADCAFTTADPFERYAAVLSERAAAFPHAAGLYDTMRFRVDPRRTAPWAESILVCAVAYGGYRVPPEVEGRFGKTYLFDRRCRDSPDYELPARLKAALIDLGVRAKKGGVPERLAAVRSGLVRFGRNCFAYHPRLGSWINIESYRLDVQLTQTAVEPDRSAWDLPCPDGCRACIDACPTGALQGPLSMDISRCIAYLTYDAPLPLDPEPESRMGRWIYGCDVCQDVCPLNEGKWEAALDRRPGSSGLLKSAGWLESRVPYLTPQALSEMDLEIYKEKVHPLFWYIPDDETGLRRWRKNAARSMAND